VYLAILDWILDCSWNHQAEPSHRGLAVQQTASQIRNRESIAVVYRHLPTLTRRVRDPFIVAAARGGSLGRRYEVRQLPSGLPSRVSANLGTGRNLTDLRANELDRCKRLHVVGRGPCRLLVLVNDYRQSIASR
jgi:hypothetical protein